MTNESYDRELIARMLEAFADWGALGGGFKPEAAMEQARLLRAADNRDAAGVHTARREPAAGVSEDAEEDAYVIRRTCELLAHIAVIVNGPEPPLTRWSYHDLPEKVQALKATHPAAGDKVRELVPDWRARADKAEAEFDSGMSSREIVMLRDLSDELEAALAQAPAVRVADEMANLRSAIMRLDGQSRRDTLVAYRKLEAALGQGRGRE